MGHIFQGKPLEDGLFDKYWHMHIEKEVKGKGFLQMQTLTRSISVSAEEISVALNNIRCTRKSVDLGGKTLLVPDAHSVSEIV